MSTYSPKPSEIVAAWHVVDADGQVLGRLATRVAHVLRGKHKPTFAPHLDSGDFVIVVNADKVKLTGNKAYQKLSYRHSGFPGGLKSTSFGKMIEDTPEKLIEQAVKGMLPKNTRRPGAAAASSRSTRAPSTRTPPRTRSLSRSPRDDHRCPPRSTPAVARPPSRACA